MSVARRRIVRGRWAGGVLPAAIATMVLAATSHGLADGARSPQAARWADGAGPAPRAEGDRNAFSMADDEGLPPVRALIQRYALDRALLQRRHGVPMSSAGEARRMAFERETLDALAAIDFASLSRDQAIDAILLRSECELALARFEAEGRRRAEMQSLLPFATALVALEEDRRDGRPLEARSVAATLADLAREVASTQGTLEVGLAAGDVPPRHVGLRAARATSSLRQTLRAWVDFRRGYDPLFTWWVEAPWRALDEVLDGYAKFLRERIGQARSGDDIVGDPIGRQALLEELRGEMIAHGPEELVALAEAEYAWCLERMVEASRELGCGDDWRAALEKVKGMHVDPGRQPELIREMALEAVAFLESRDLITVPPLAKEGWRMEMMSAERQRVNPYFLGGESIIVSFPTSDMTHEEKLMSLRSNNEHFCRAVVHHELIPGHHLQGFMTARHRAHRQLFETPFWIEGWAVWWEMHLWDLGFPRNAADRVGMLFWRMHRCVRVVFSLGFHLGELTPEQCIDMLVQRVGHERSAAEAEVRRSFAGDYGPLYQAAYLIGAMQFRTLHAELVGGGRMSERAFHDAVLRLGPIPVELVRASLVEDVALEPAFEARWRFGER